MQMASGRFGRFAGVACALIISACVACAAVAQTPDSRVMHVIVPYPAGGVTDAVARGLAAQLGESTGRTVVVDNRPGASTVIGMQQCARAAPDGLTVCITNPDSLSYGPQLFSRLPYDVERDFAPVINLGFTNNLLVAKSGAPFDTYREMIAYAKAHPGKLNWGTWGAATLPDVYLRWIAHRAGVDIVAIHYKGASGTIPAIMSGEVDITYMGFGTALPLIRAGKMKALVATGERRSAYMPDLPSLAEEGGDPGLPSYFGVFAPGATPPAELERLNAEFAKAIRAEAVQALYRLLTLDAVPSSVVQFAAFTRADRANAANVFRSVGITPGESP
jgi:tripartite-type tricarboxylate transporter receptor subunit TctC